MCFSGLGFGLVQPAAEVAAKAETGLLVAQQAAEAKQEAEGTAAVAR
jgi:hypothetical protein